LPVTIADVEPGSLAARLGWRAGDQVLEVDGRPVDDELDFRFKTAEESFEVRLRRAAPAHDAGPAGAAALESFRVARGFDQEVGVRFEDFRIRTCGDDCVFCFVDQNPAGLRDTLYFRDGDFRMSFLYGNYITMTNLRDRDLERIVEQRLSPLYVSVHCTDDDVRRRMMGHRAQRDRLQEKLRFLAANGIDLHAQIVLVPGFNDAGALVKTVADLYGLHERMESVTIVPVGITGHREGLAGLRNVTPAEAAQLVRFVEARQRFFRQRIGRGFVYASDEVYLLAGVDFPDEADYDGYPLMENGVGMCRDFLNELAFQAEELPPALPAPRRVTLATGALAGPFLEQRVRPVLQRVGGLDVRVVVAENRLFGVPVTVSGLLNWASFHAALAPLADAGELGDAVFLPPDCVNVDGCFLDETPGRATPADLAAELGVPVEVFGGDWAAVVGG